MSRLPGPPRHTNIAKEWEQWADRLVRAVEQQLEDITAFRATSYNITSTASGRTFTATMTATEVKDFVGKMAKDLQDARKLP